MVELVMEIRPGGGDSGKREKYAAQGESETSLHPRQSGCCSFHDSPWPR